MRERVRAIERERKKREKERERRSGKKKSFGRQKFQNISHRDRTTATAANNFDVT